MIKILTSLSGFVKRDPEFLMDLAYGELQSELISLRRECAQAVAFEQRLTQSGETDGAVAQTQSEHTAALRDLLIEMEGQVEGFSSLKQWILLSVPMGDPELSRELSKEYSRFVQSVITVLKGVHRLRRQRTPEDTRLLTRQMQTEDSARKRLGQLVRQRLTALVDRLSASERDASAGLKLKRAQVALENRLRHVDSEIKRWAHEATVAKDGGNELAFLQACARQAHYITTADSITEALGILRRSIGSASSHGKATAKG